MRIRNQLKLAGCAALLASGINAAPALAKAGKGMTWRTYDFTAPANTNAAQVQAWSALKAAEPEVVVVGCNNSCNAFVGDTATSQLRRILCIVPGSTPEPALYAPVFTGSVSSSAASSNWRFYYGWSGGTVGLTKPVPGTSITSRLVGDGICKQHLGDNGARMAEHHDNKVGGWAFGARIHPGSQAIGLLRNAGGGDATRFWTAIKNQQGNPWNP